MSFSYRYTVVVILVEYNNNNKKKNNKNNPIPAVHAELPALSPIYK